MSYKTTQEAFWAGEFGNEYIARNGEESIPQRIRLLAKALERSSGIRSVAEFGANIGLNLRALRQIMPGAEYCAVEINERACDALRKEKWITVYNASLFDFKPIRTFDLVLVQGVLIHINPGELQTVYELLYRSSNKYICISEYYNPTPVEVQYRGHAGKLFKRDFAGELMATHPDLELIDYGFAYRRDKNFPGDDLTWFLLEKR